MNNIQAVESFLREIHNLWPIEDYMAAEHDVHPLYRFPELALLLEVEPITLVGALDLLRFRQAERVDGEVPTLLADVQIDSAEDLRERLERAADVKDVRLRPIFIDVGQ